MISTVLVRYSEVFLKKGKRPHFLRVLRRNLEEALRARGVSPGQMKPRADKGTEYPLSSGPIETGTPLRGEGAKSSREGGEQGIRVEPFRGRYEIAAGKSKVLTPEQIALALNVAQHTFGVSSASPAVRVPRDFEAIAQAVLKLTAQAVDERRVATFRIDTSRADKSFPMRSPEVNGALGARVLEHHDLKVRMRDPDLVVSVEIFNHAAYVFTQTVRGPGGLPIGTGGRVLLLLSGGIDSPVAGWMMAKRGCSVSAVHFHSFPFTTRKSIRKVEELALRLSKWLGQVKVTMVPLAPIQEYLRNKAPSDKLVLFYRRSMMRISTELARRNGCLALVTGESLGQVASQTVENICAIQDAAGLVVLRPLIGMDKSEIIALAKRIGTYETSIVPHDDCCTLFVPPHPETRADLEFIKRYEAGLDELPGLEARALEEAEERTPSGEGL